ncbi:MAG: hypothetical protein LAT68_14425 [Cyclobacteriaceae bacterium]|nr:hypothetical protein [Cyclobacteriaceae bacterium]MCH8517517.1 hypothetical protein [Cyclobacteriaceae bacterium]
MRKIIFIVSIGIAFLLSACSKNSVPVSNNNNTIESSRNFSGDAGSSSAPKRSNKKSRKTFMGFKLEKNHNDRLAIEQKKRVRAVEKKRKKEAKMAKKPQYSDPTYLGHKRKPKKRPPGKRKFCKECGMVH